MLLQSEIRIEAQNDDGKWEDEEGGAEENAILIRSNPAYVIQIN